MIVEIAGVVDRPVVEIEAPGEAAVRKTRRPSKEVEAETDGVAGPRHAMARRLRKHVGLPGRDPQAAKFGPAPERGQIDMLMEGAALPIDAMLEPKRPSAILEPSRTHMRSQVPVPDRCSIRSGAVPHEGPALDRSMMLADG